MSRLWGSNPGRDCFSIRAKDRPRPSYHASACEARRGLANYPPRFMSEKIDRLYVITDDPSTI